MTIARLPERSMPSTTSSAVLSEPNGVVIRLSLRLKVSAVVLVIHPGDQIGPAGEARERPNRVGAMDDQEVLNRIDELVREEEELRHRHDGDGEGLTSDEVARMEELKVQLDKAWDYLRQRRALRQYGDNPDDASERDGGTVEEYGDVKPYDDADVE